MLGFLELALLVVEPAGVDLFDYLVVAKGGLADPLLQPEDVAHQLLLHVVELLFCALLDLLLHLPGLIEQIPHHLLQVLYVVVEALYLLISAPGHTLLALHCGGGDIVLVDSIGACHISLGLDLRQLWTAGAS